MAAVIQQDGLDQFRIRFGELARVRRGQPVQIDPFLIARAIALVMRECTVRSAAGRPITWNQYRMILARRDFDQIRPLQAPLERDLRQVLAEEAKARQAELVGELRVTVVFDEADELPQGEGVVRVAFVPTERLAAPRPGEMTMRLDAFMVSGEIAARAPSAGGDTVSVDDAPAATGWVMRWPGGQAPLVPGHPIAVGRPHSDPPAPFVALAGAGAKVNKLHFWIAVSSAGVRIGRFAKANPVHANGRSIGAGEELEVALPAEISLSHGDLVLSVTRA
ncbi:MAG TPA: FhaA domain-containing protein [Kofleriaceae bacterium]|nr:FhaA domain-containing protein [Kofleriaceae bacterium]